MDNRTLGAALGGALLVGSSARRVERAAQRSTQVNVLRSVERLRYSWVRKMTHLGAIGVASFGLVLLAYGNRRYRASLVGAAIAPPPDEVPSDEPLSTSPQR